MATRFHARTLSWALGPAFLFLAGGPIADYRTIPAALDSELTPAVGETIGSGADWARSNGDHASSRFSNLKQIDRTDVSRLNVAWTYRSGDGQGNIEANPVVVKGVMYVPTPGRAIVAVDAATGREIWRFHPEGRPAFRGLVYWQGDASHAARLYFPSGDWLYAIDASSGKPIASFGHEGRVTARSTVAPAIFESVIVIP